MSKQLTVSAIISALTMTLFALSISLNEAANAPSLSDANQGLFSATILAD